MCYHDPNCFVKKRKLQHFVRFSSKKVLTFVRSVQYPSLYNVLNLFLWFATFGIKPQTKRKKKFTKILAEENKILYTHKCNSNERTKNYPWIVIIILQKFCERKTSQSECLRLTLHSLIKKNGMFIFFHRKYYQTKYTFVHFDVLS